MSKEKIGLLIAEDSESLLQLYISTFKKDPDIEVLGVARNGKEAVEQTLRLKPKVITMDLVMPVMDGAEAIKKIMAVRPTPIVVVTSMSESTKAFEAMRSGAVELVQKPKNVYSPEGAKTLRRIVDSVKTMAGIKLITRKYASDETRPGDTKIGDLHSGGKITTAEHDAIRPSNLSFSASPPNMSHIVVTHTARIVTIASSTGGPPALLQVLKHIDRDFPLPIVIVQHITPGFCEGFIDWLGKSIKLNVVEAEREQLPMPGNVYIAPDNYHLLIASNGRFRLSSALPIKGHRPSANLLFESAAEFYGLSTLGIILTGMGEDGVLGLKVLKKLNGYCIAQDEASSTVFGMPKVAIESGLADTVLNLDEIGGYLINLGRKLAQSRIKL